MKVPSPPSVLPPEAAGRAARAPSPPPWQVGQILRARVVGNAPAPAPPSGPAVLLQIGTRLVRAQTPVPLQAGERLTLEVLRTSPVPVLRHLPESPGKSPAPEAALEGLRLRALPRQQGLQALLAPLDRLLRPGRSAALPPPVQAIGRQLLEALPTPRKIRDAEGLRRAIASSGLLLERHLARADPAVGRDLKGLLLRLAARLADAASRNQPPARGTRATPISRAVAPATAPSMPLAGNPGPRTTAPGAAPELVRIIGRLPATTAGPLSAPGALARLAGVPGTGGSPVAPPAPGPAAAGAVPETPPPLPQRAPVPQAAPAAAPGGLETGLQELARAADGAVARIELHQAVSRTPDPQAPGLWMLELPVRSTHGIDLFHLRIEQERPQGEDPGSERGWNVQIAFDLPGLGPAHARLNLIGDRISVRFWAERAGSAAVLAAAMAELGTRLERAGLVPAHLGASPGTPPAPPVPGTRPGATLDAHA